MVVIRAGSAADAAQIAAVQREGWLAAYAGIIPAETIDRVTAPDHGARVRQTFRTRPWQRMLVGSPPSVRRGRAGTPWPHPLTTDGEDGSVADSTRFTSARPGGRPAPVGAGSGC